MEEKFKELSYEDMIENKENIKEVPEVEEEKTDEEYEQMILRYKRIKYSRYL